MKKLWYFLGVTPFLFVLSFNAAADRIQLGFESTVSDYDVIDIIKQYDGRPRAVFMSTSGLNGSYRSYEPVNIDAFVDEARAEAIEAFAAGVKTHRTFLRKINANPGAATRPPARTAKDKKQLRSALKLLEQAKKALHRARSNGPIFYGLEMDLATDSTDVTKFQNHEKIRKAIKIDSNDNGLKVRRALKPPGLVVGYESDVIDSASDSEIDDMVAVEVTP